MVPCNGAERAYLPSPQEAGTITAELATSTSRSAPGRLDPPGVFFFGETMKYNLMKTYEGNYVDPTAVSPKDVSSVDIAHALSNICRFNGHCSHFHSVASHSLYVSLAVGDYLLHAIDLTAAGRLTQMALVDATAKALLHDAGEAYVGDHTTPIKYSVPALREADKSARAAVFESFGLDQEMPPVINVMDKIITMMELDYFVQNAGPVGLEPCEDKAQRYIDAAIELGVVDTAAINMDALKAAVQISVESFEEDVENRLVHGDPSRLDDKLLFLAALDNMLEIREEAIANL